MQSWTQSYSTPNNQTSQSVISNLPPLPMVTSSAALSPNSLSSSPVHGSTSSATASMTQSLSSNTIANNNLTSYNYPSIGDHHSGLSLSSSQHHNVSLTPPSPSVSTSSYPFYSSSFDQSQWRGLSTQNKVPTIANSHTGIGIGSYEWDAAYRYNIFVPH